MHKIDKVICGDDRFGLKNLQNKTDNGNKGQEQHFDNSEGDSGSGNSHPGRVRSERGNLKRMQLIKINQPVRQAFQPAGFLCLFKKYTKKCAFF